MNTRRSNCGNAACHIYALMATLMAAAPYALATAPPLPVIPTTEYLATSYGASANGSSVDTSAIQNAINAASGAGGGVVLLGAVAGSNNTYLSGAISMKSDVNLEIASGVTLEMQAKNAYTSGSTPFISANNISNAEISGAGTINGQGATWWSNPSSSRPFLVDFQNSSTVAFNNVTLLNSPMENLAFNNTNNVTVNGITVSAPSNSPNTDGVDPAGNNYLIENSSISTGDDDIAVKPQNSSCSNIVIQNDSIGTGHGISVGGETNAGLNGMSVSNVTFNGTTNGLRLKAGIGNGGVVQNITYNNISMKNVSNPIYITSYYVNGGDHSPSNPATVVSAPLTSLTPVWKNITLSNITATGADRSGIVYGLPQAPVENLSMNNISISASQDFELYYAQNTLFTGGTSASTLSGLVTYDATVNTPEPSPLALLSAALAATGLGLPLGKRRHRIKICAQKRINKCKNIKN